MSEHYFTSRGSADRFEVVETNDKGTEQYRKVRGLSDETFEKVIVIFPHGFSSVSPAESHMLGVALGGRRDTLALLGGEHPDHRPKDTPVGGTVLYDANGKALKMFPDTTTWDLGGKPLKITNASEVVIGVPGRFIRIRPGRIDLAVKSESEDAPAKVMTEDGPSEVVWARID